jgi:hypothetical protein
MLTLGIDYGASNIGIALVRNTKEGNEPLFAGTIKISAKFLKGKVEVRAGIRGLRRTRKTKHRRLQMIHDELVRLGVDVEIISCIVGFCKRRGYKYGPTNEETQKKTESQKEIETYSVSREVFFEELEKELTLLLPSHELYDSVLSVCEKVLNRKGERSREIRETRIDNRGVSRCAWKDCDRVTPRKINAISDCLNQQLFLTLKQGLDNAPSLAGDVYKAIHELDELGVIIRNLVTPDSKKEKSDNKKKATRILGKLRDDLFNLDADKNERKRAWKFVQKSILNLIEKPTGRNAYCHGHSKEYVKMVRKGQSIPFKTTIQTRDIISRREQILFEKIWRYIQARILPLCDHKGIDYLVVERVAFDLLVASRKKIGEASDEQIEDMYSQGPMYQFKSRTEMLQKEFGGLCAYCGTPSDKLIEVEHILPKREFAFDSYLNIVPSCPRCNAEKGSSSPSSRLLKINEDAYNAYSEYYNQLKKKRPPHPFHNIKKGLLNLMKDKNRVVEAERFLSMIANNLSGIVQTQRGPRPLSRFLSTKLSQCQKKTPLPSFLNGRQTALYRYIAYPEFDKIRDKKESLQTNHALDAIILASRLPGFEMLRTNQVSTSTIQHWKSLVLKKAPPASNGNPVPQTPHHNFLVNGFEQVDKFGYVTIDLTHMNWNHRDSMIHKEDPYGWTTEQELDKSNPCKRIAAQDLCKNLLKLGKVKDVSGYLARIRHPRLRQVALDAWKIKDSLEAVVDVITNWLRKSIANSIDRSKFSNHPADVKRREDLVAFVNGIDKPIPSVIGIKMDTIGVGSNVVCRWDKQAGKISHRYMTHPPNRGVILAYPKKTSGVADCSKPQLAYIKQNHALVTDGRAFGDLPPVLRDGQVFGLPSLSSTVWLEHVKDYLKECNFHSFCILRAGCVVCYEDGTNWFVKNFDDSDEFKKSSRLRNVVAIRRTPLTEKAVPLKNLT